MAIDLRFITGNDTLFEIILPLVLIFTIVFAVLQSTNILGGKKNIDSIIALVFGFLLIRSTKAVEVINSFLPNISLTIIVILMILLVIGVFLGEKAEWAHGLKGFAALIAVIVVLWIFGASYFKKLGVPNVFGNLSSETKGILIFIAVLIILIYFVTREEGEKKNRWEELGETIFNKKK